MIEFKKYKKVARTFARLLTSQDYEERKGVVYAPEGILKFTPGDYLAKDTKGECRAAHVGARSQGGGTRLGPRHGVFQEASGVRWRSATTRFLP